MCKITNVQVDGTRLQVGRTYDLYVKPDLSGDTRLFRKQTFRGTDCNGTFAHLMFTDGTVPRHGLVQAVEWSAGRDEYWRNFEIRARNGQIGH